MISHTHVEKSKNEAINIMKTKGNRIQIENSLLEQLAMLGAMKEHYIDLIRDYTGMWLIKKALLEDIKERGVTYDEYNPQGHLVRKNNPSVKELVMVNKQMLSLLKELGLSTSKVGDGEGDEL